MPNIYDMTDQWDDGGTAFNAIKMNVTQTASAANSKLIDLQIGGSSKFNVDKDGNVTGTNIIPSGDDVSKFNNDVRYITKVENDSSGSPSFLYDGNDLLSGIYYSNGDSKKFSYTGNNLTEVEFAFGEEEKITKTYNYTGDILTSITEVYDDGA